MNKIFLFCKSTYFVPPFIICQISLGEALISAGCQLVELDLSDNAFGPDGVRGFEALLKSPTCFTLQELKLNNCGMGIGGGKVKTISSIFMKWKVECLTSNFPCDLFLHTWCIALNCCLTKPPKLMGKSASFTLMKSILAYSWPVLECSRRNSS